MEMTSYRYACLHISEMLHPPSVPDTENDQCLLREDRNESYPDTQSSPPGISSKAVNVPSMFLAAMPWRSLSCKLREGRAEAVCLTAVSHDLITCEMIPLNSNSNQGDVKSAQREFCVLNPWEDLRGCSVFASLLLFLLFPFGKSRTK